jgi:hypothetical protein
VLAAASVAPPQDWVIAEVMRATSSPPGATARKSNSIRVRPEGSVRISITAMVNPSTRHRRLRRMVQWWPARTVA